MGSSSTTATALEQKGSDEEMVLNDLHIETGDQNAVKNLLDDTIVEFFKENKKYQLHYGWDNAKMILMAVAIIIAAISHFYKPSFISENVLIYICVSGFFFIQALLVAYATFIEKDILLRMTRAGSNPGKTILVRTTFPYSEAHYTVSIHQADAKEKPRKEELYVGRFFDKEGYFSKEAFLKDIETVLSRFEQKDKKQ
ncbi:signal peptidase complex subunit 2 [Plasmopara halstedii]|uniref:Signal peptidase complex subunit 2 n=1 Tax=Plasmopara halstedii TaxID=4781 RepID=A0A0N7L8A5_PLAHL|nr:signal peptidase complex subunit 2 [Plasmopara halstedii]CEG49331.1 signal peptidase complex subunit 2 [Plasmopara halstedii]|eukprot:XP_024585700.1 signal peptidase complex subunit 2 [Plasmopara halstedii]